MEKGGVDSLIFKDNILIGGVVWEITIEDLDDAGAYGITEFNKCKIRLHKSDKPEMIEAHFWHEILHIVHGHAGYYQGKEMIHNEHLVEAETHILHQIMTQVISWQK